MKFFSREKRGGKARPFSCTGEGKTFEYGWSIGLREGSESGLEGWRGGKKPQALALHRPVRGPPLLSPDCSSGSSQLSALSFIASSLTAGPQVSASFPRFDHPPFLLPLEGGALSSQVFVLCKTVHCFVVQGFSV